MALYVAHPKSDKIQACTPKKYKQMNGTQNKITAIIIILSKKITILKGLFVSKVTGLSLQEFQLC